MTRYSSTVSLVAASLTAAILLSACYPTPGPDKSVTGAILGAGWGAGAGAVIGNQIGDPGPGAAIGAGFGAASGLMTGIGFDIAEGGELEQQRQIDALKVQVASNQRSLAMLQANLDDRARQINSGSASQQIFFDPDRASLRVGTADQLERLANSIKSNPYVSRVEVHGHSDDSGDTERNMRLSEARARTVVAFLSTQGLSLDAIAIIPHGSRNPLASNENEAGRQLNRRVEVVLKP